MSINNKMTFEEAVSKLEELVSRMESGGLTLDESLAAYEEAMALVRLCSSRISEAELKVKQLVEASDGSISDKPFRVGDED